MSWILFCLSFVSFSFAFFPFTGEDTDTLGKGKFQLEFQYAYFKHYDKTMHHDAIVQLTGGVVENMDMALILPYSLYRYSDGIKNSGFSDMGIFIKHIPIKVGYFEAGYKLQINLNTGKRGIGYGKITANLNIITQVCKGDICYNANFLYIKANFVEELRDTYGAIFCFYRKVSDDLIIGSEIKFLKPTQDGVNKLDSHVLFGGVYSLKRLSVSFGFHKSVTKHESFANYGILASLLLLF